MGLSQHRSIRALFGGSSSPKALVTALVHREEVARTLFTLEKVPITRYRYRETNILTPLARTEEESVA